MPLLAATPRLVADCQMTGNTNLTAHLHPCPDFGAARQPDLGGQQYALAQLAAVGDHHQIVDLAPPADMRRPQGGPVNRGVLAPISTSSSSTT